MSDRVVDPTRQGVSHEPEDMAAPCSAAPVPVLEALAAVEGWERSGMPLFGLHRIAQALRDGVVAAVLCHKGRGLDCTEYPWALCCTARRRILGVTGYRSAALSKGDPVAVDWLGDGIVHVFGDVRMDEVRYSRGCVRLIEPTVDDD